MESKKKAIIETVVAMTNDKTAHIYEEFEYEREDFIQHVIVSKIRSTKNIEFTDSEEQHVGINYSQVVYVKAQHLVDHSELPESYID